MVHNFPHKIAQNKILQGIIQNSHSIKFTYLQELFQNMVKKCESNTFFWKTSIGVEPCCYDVEGTTIKRLINPKRGINWGTYYECTV